MKWPRVSSFFWIGLVLLGIGAYALFKGPGFMFDPGVPPEPHEALFYLAIGVVMVVNGVIHPTASVEEAAAKSRPSETQPTHSVGS
ncbi:MAG: hypothetical protein P4L33_16675 [Capsulimonadaceae bacterium]|nr:hypothetical protein [Capsulimonadaceae bacterium]